MSYHATLHYTPQHYTPCHAAPRRTSTRGSARCTHTPTVYLRHFLHVPQSKTLASEPNFLKIDQSTLPIEIFDSIQFEESDRAPDEWVESCSGGVVPYFANGDWKWRRCEVQSYDAETKMFK